MRISAKRHEKLYRAIADPIMDLRVKHSMGEVKNIDADLFVLVNRIHKEIKEALELTKT
jgi:hypothetical protein